jgi:hypothetical protein
MFFFHDDVFVPFLVFAIPCVAIAGGILAGIIRTVSSHRLMEAVVRERMALVAKGVDPARIPVSAGSLLAGASLLSLRDATRLRAQGLLVAGFVILAGGGSFAAVSYALDSWDGGDWGIGVVAASVGLALIASGLIIWPRGHQAHDTAAELRHTAA